MKSVRYFLLGSMLLALAMENSQAQQGPVLVFEQNFDLLPLRPPIDEESTIPNAFTLIPPDNWRTVSDLPGAGNPEIGVSEWEGWSFANKDFWIEVSEDELRSEFKKSQGTIAVADPDEWNDLGNPANRLGFFEAFLHTPEFSIAELKATGDRLRFLFDSSWLPQCCDDGERFAPNENNKTATIRVRFEDGSSQTLVQWESAPFFFIDSSGNTHPSTDPQDIPNPRFKSTDLNESVLLNIDSLLDSGHLSFQLEFGLTNAGDDWWWAMDNMMMISMTTVPGDMDLSGFLDTNDIDDFAQAMHNTEAYRADHFDEHPSIRGSLDSVFDFDDIDWFVGLLNDQGFSTSKATVLAAIAAQAVPEPTGLSLALLALVVCCSRRSRLLLH